jgi:hypothetical protein
VDGDEPQLPGTAVRESVWDIRGANDYVTKRYDELSVAELKRRLSGLHDEHLRVGMPVQLRTLARCTVDKDHRERHLAMLRADPFMEAIGMGQLVERHHSAECVR